jgi:protein-S-isoprenylcysteine O-methyltransferase Ste14
MSNSIHLALLMFSWTLYGILHSLLASHACKNAVRNRFPDAFRVYRLTYNLLAVLLLIPPLWLLFSYPGDLLWRWPTALRWLADIAALSAVAGFIWSAKFYDTREFLGFRQLSQTTLAMDDQAPMSLSFAHRFVRHPWYFLGLVIIWTREMNTAFLLTAVTLTLYLLIGSRQEEKKLVACYGEQYRRYQASVPGLVPRPWCYISRQQAEEILGMEKKTS